MLDSPKDMQAYIQAYFAQMAGMQTMNILSQLSKAPEEEGIKDDLKAEAGEAVKDAAAAPAGAAAVKLIIRCRE